MTQDSELTVIPKRIGGSIVLFIPAELVRRRRIREGVPVRVTIGPNATVRALGTLKRRRRHKPFDRHSEGFWDDS